MKERIVVDFEDVKCAEDKNYVIARKEKCKVEKYPETFEELKELCKGKFAEISEHSIMIFGMLDFFDDGTLTFHNYCEIVNDLTPQQMYQIIKSLIGEE